MGKNVLITGGAGFIGSHLTDKLTEKGYRVRVIDNLDPQVHGNIREIGELPTYANPQAEYIIGDVRNKELLQYALQGIDVIYHFAAAVGVGQSMYKVQHYVDVNITGTATFLDILANNDQIKKQIKKLVVASSMSNYGEGKYRCPIHGNIIVKARSHQQLAAHQWEPLCPIINDSKQCNLPLIPVPTDESKPLNPTSIYAITKITQEEMCLNVGQAYNIPTAALRYFNIYGNRQSLSNPYTGLAAIFSGRILNKEAPIIFEDGLQKRDLIHISDITQANILVMENIDAHQKIYNVGTGNPLTLIDIARTLIDEMGSQVTPKILNQYRVGDMRHCFPDITRLQKIGFKPKVTFKSGVSEFVEWVKQQTSIDQYSGMQSELRQRGLMV